MKLIYDPIQDHKQLRKLIQLYILTLPEGDIVSGMSLRVNFNMECGIDIDHHEWAYELDALDQQKKLVKHYAYHGGDTQYIRLPNGKGA